MRLVMVVAMKASGPASPPSVQTASSALRGVAASQYGPRIGERATVVFHLGRDVGSLNPCGRANARQLLLEMNRIQWAARPATGA